MNWLNLLSPSSKNDSCEEERMESMHDLNGIAFAKVREEAERVSEFIKEGREEGFEKFDIEISPELAIRLEADNGFDAAINPMRLDVSVKVKRTDNGKCILNVYYLLTDPAYGNFATAQMMYLMGTLTAEELQEKKERVLQEISSQRDNEDPEESSYRVSLVDPKIAKKMVEVFSQEEFDAEVDLEIYEDKSADVYIAGNPRLFEEIKKFSNMYAIDMRVVVFDSDKKNESPWQDFLPEVYSYTITCPDEESVQKMESELSKLDSPEMNIWNVGEEWINVEAVPCLLDEIKRLSDKLSMEVEVGGYPRQLDFEEAEEDDLYVTYNFPKDPSPEELKADW
jgi:hypothetical protein